MPLPGSPREKEMKKQFLQEIVEPEVQTEEVVEDEAPKPKAKKKKASKGRKKVLGLF